jgi:hypothetical protein
MAKRYLARNTFLEMGDGASEEVFARIAQVISYTGPGMTTTFENFDDHDVESGFIEKLPVSKDAGQLSFEVHWDPADPTHIALEDEYLDNMSPDPVNWRFHVPTDENPRRSKAFRGFVANLGPIQAASNGKLTREFTLELTGKPDRQIPAS